MLGERLTRGRFDFESHAQALLLELDHLAVERFRQANGDVADLACVRDLGDARTVDVTPVQDVVFAVVDAGERLVEQSGRADGASRPVDDASQLLPQHAATSRFAQGVFQALIGIAVFNDQYGCGGVVRYEGLKALPAEIDDVEGIVVDSDPLEQAAERAVEVL